MYKDKEKQREANRRAQAKRREGMTKGAPDIGYDGEGMTDEPQLIPDSQIPSAVVRPQVERDGSYADFPMDPAHALGQPRDPQNWQASQEYAEVFHRLTHWTLAKLQSAGHWIPVWREALG